MESGSMDVYEASGNMVAFSDFVVLAAKAQFGNDVEVRAEVAGFDKGSFVTDIVFQVSGAAATIYSAATTESLWKAIHGAIELWKFLRGRPPKQVAPAVHQNITVTNNDGQIIQISMPSFTIVMSEKGSATVGKFIHQALERPGMDAVEIAGDKNCTPVRISQSESKYFVPVAPSETVTDVIVRMHLIIEAPVFKEDNKWRFSDGQQSFFANVEDEEFLGRVNTGERFGKGDILSADVRINQQQSGLRLSAERTIVKVHAHMAGPAQMELK